MWSCQSLCRLRHGKSMQEQLWNLESRLIECDRAMKAQMESDGCGHAVSKNLHLSSRMNTCTMQALEALRQGSKELPEIARSLLPWLSERLGKLLRWKNWKGIQWGFKMLQYGNMVINGQAKWHILCILWPEGDSDIEWSCFVRLRLKEEADDLAEPAALTFELLCAAQDGGDSRWSHRISGTWWIFMVPDVPGLAWAWGFSTWFRWFRPMVEAHQLLCHVWSNSDHLIRFVLCISLPCFILFRFRERLALELPCLASNSSFPAAAALGLCQLCTLHQFAEVVTGSAEPWRATGI